MSKPVPAWAKLVIGLAIFFFLIGVGIRILSGVIFGGERGEKLVEMATDGKVAVEFAGENHEVQLPADFPKDVPVFAPVTVKGVVTIAGTINVSLESDRLMSEVASFYQSQLPSQGWVSASVLNSEGGFFGTFTKENRQLIVAITPKEEGGAEHASIGLTYSRQIEMQSPENEPSSPTSEEGQD